MSLREESFGALAYHHVNRRLVFLKSPTLVSLVRTLGDYASVDDALVAVVPEHEHASYQRALGSLILSEVLSGG